MFFIDGKNEAVSSKNDECVDKRIFDFSFEQEDYFLNYHVAWDKIEGDFYDVDVAGSVYSVPSGMYILCSCDEGDSDWIMVDEIIGRDIEVFMMTKSFRAWNMSPIKIKNYYQSHCFFPMSRTPVPVFDNSHNKVILLSTIDQHSKMHDKHFQVFLV